MGGPKKKKSTEIQEPRLQLLREELSLARVRLPAIAGTTEEDILAELLYALSPPVHEEKEPTYGAIITPGKHDQLPNTIVDAPVGPEMRLAANGTSAFLHLTRGQRRYVVFDRYMGGEETLAALATELLSIVVQRDPTGAVRVFVPFGIHVNQGRSWWYKQGWYRLQSNLYRHVPQADFTVLSRILAFAVHVLSAGHVGATLVWWLREPSLSTSTRDKALDLRPLTLKVIGDHYPSIRHILLQHDGATMIGPKGDVLSVGHHLHASDKARNLVPETRGTRHTSARRYSFDEASVVVVTISQDGPVSIFSDGAFLGDVAPYSAELDAEALREAVPPKKEDIFDSEWEEICSRCGKTNVVQEVLITGWRETEEAYCQVCRAQVAQTRCFKLGAYVKKTLD